MLSAKMGFLRAPSSRNSTMRISQSYSQRELVTLYDTLSMEQQSYLNQRAAERRKTTIKQKHQAADLTVSLKDVLQDYCEVLAPFYEFLKKSHAEENLDFLKELATFHGWLKCGKDVKDIAIKIFKRYVHPSGTRPLNLDGTAVTKIESEIENGNIHKDLWKEAQQEIIHLLDGDLLPKFLKDSTFLEWRELELKRREKDAKKNETPPWVAFIEAIKKNAPLETLEWLLNQGATPRDEDEQSLQTALHIAAAKLNRPDIVSLLLSKNADVNALDSQGWTALHVATNCGNLHVCELLIQNGANVQAMTKDKNSSLNYLAKNNYSADEIPYCLHVLNLILKKTEKINEQNFKGETCLHYCCRNTSCAAPDIMLALLKSGASPNIKNRRGYTPLHTAILQEQDRLVKLMLEYGGDTSIRCTANGSNLSCLELAQKVKSESIINLLEMISMIDQPTSPVSTRTANK